MKLSIFAIALVIFSSMLSGGEKFAGLLLSKDYLSQAQSLAADPESKAILAIAVGLKYRETIQPNYKTWFENLHSSLNGETLGKETAQSLEIIDTLVNTSTVSAIDRIEAGTDTGPVLKAVSLRVYFYDWVDTHDPASQRAVLSLAWELLATDSDHYFPYKALLEIYSASTPSNGARLEQVRSKILEGALAQELGADLVRSEFLSGLMDLVREDYVKLALKDSVSTYYAAIAFFDTGEKEEARVLLEELDYTELPPKLASRAANLRGDLRFEDGEILGAIELYQSAIRFWPENSLAVKNLGMAYYQTHQREYYDLARFYLQLSGFEKRDEAVSSALKELRRRAIFELALVTVLPLAVVVVGGLFLLEYVSRKRKTSQLERALKKDGGNDEDKST